MTAFALPVFSILLSLLLGSACNAKSSSKAKSESQIPIPKAEFDATQTLVATQTPVAPDALQELATFIGPWSGASNQHVQEVLKALQESDRQAYNALLMSRAMYESRCRLLIERNSPGWLDRKMSSRKGQPDDNHALQTCSMLQTDSPVEVVWLEGGEVAGKQVECTGIEVLKPYRALVRVAGELFSLRIDSARNTHDGSYVLHHARCGPTVSSRLACHKLEFFMQQESKNSLHSLECNETLRAESAETSEVAIQCLEGAKTLADAQICWGKRKV